MLVGLLLVFRTNSSYSRYEEGVKALVRAFALRPAPYALCLMPYALSHNATTHT